MLEQHFHDASSRSDFARRYLAYLSDLMQQLDIEVIDQIMATFLQCAEEGRTIYLIANGGSAAIASHYANDIGFGIEAPGKPPVKIISLNDNMAVITAVANDTGFDNIFVRQLEAVLTDQDVVVAMSVSGNSPNILKAIEYAQSAGATTIGLTGFDGGKLRNMVDINLHVQTPTGEYGPVEDIFQILDHLLYTYLRMARLGRLAH